jgi:hypothetical protein
MKGRTRAARRESQKQPVFQNTMKGIPGFQATKSGSEKGQESAIRALSRKSGRFQKYH